MLNLDMRVGDMEVKGRLVLLDIPDFVDCPQEALPSLKSRWRRERKCRGGRYSELWLICKMNFKNLKIKSASSIKKERKAVV